MQRRGLFFAHQALEDSLRQGSERGIGPIARSGQINRPLPGGAALFKQDDPVGQRSRLIDVVRDQDDRGAGLLSKRLLYETLHVQSRQRVQTVQRLVKKQQSGARGQSAGERYTLFLCARQDGGPILNAIGQTNIAQHLRDTAAILVRKPKPDILADAQPRQQPAILKHDMRRGGQAVQYLAANSNEAGIRPVQLRRARNQPPEIRGFAPAPNCRLPVPTMLIASENESLHDASSGA
jgi:hypothetical protein